MHPRHFQPVGGSPCPSQTNSVQTSSSVDGDPVTLRTANGIGCGGAFAVLSSNGDVVGSSQRYVTSFPQYATTGCYRHDTAASAGTGCYGDCSSSQPTVFYEQLVQSSNAVDGQQYHPPYIDTCCSYTGIQNNRLAACFQPIHQHHQQQQQQPLQGVLDYRFGNVGHVTPSYTSPGPTHRCLPSVPQYTVPLHYTGPRHFVIQQVLQPEIADQSGAAITMLVQSPTLTSSARCQCGPPTVTDVMTSPPESANDEARAFPVQSHGHRRISTCNVMLSQPLSNEDENGNGIEVRRPVMENWNDQLVSESATNQHAVYNSYRQQAATSTENYDARPGANEISETATVGPQRTPRTARRVVQQAARGTPLYGQQPDWWGEPDEEIDQSNATNDSGGGGRNFTENNHTATDVRRPTNLGLETTFRQTARAEVTQTPPERDSSANFGSSSTSSSFRDRQVTSQVALAGASDSPAMTATIFSTFQQKPQGMTSATTTRLPFQQTTPGFSSTCSFSSGGPNMQSPNSSAAQNTPIIDHRLMIGESLLPSDTSAEVTPSSRPQSSSRHSVSKQMTASTESDVDLCRQKIDNGDANCQYPLSKDDDEHNRKTSPVTTKILDNATSGNCRWSNASDSVFNSPADDCSHGMTSQIKVSSAPSTARSNASCSGDDNSKWRPPPTGGAAFIVSLDDDDESGGLDLSLKISTLLPVSLQQRQARTTTKPGRRSLNDEDKKEPKQLVNNNSGVLSSTKRTSGTFRKATAATSAPQGKKFLTRSNATERYNAADEECPRTKTIDLADEQDEEDNEESGDAVSETGTYTIDSSDDDEVKQARKNIEKEFGIQTDDVASSDSSLNLTPSKRRLPLVPDGSTTSVTNSKGEHIDNQMTEDLQVSAAKSTAAYSALATATFLTTPLSTAVEQLDDSNHQSTLVAKRTSTQQTSKEQDSSQETVVGERRMINDINGADKNQAGRGNNQNTIFDAEEARIEASSKWKQINSDSTSTLSTSFQQQQQQQVQIVRPEISSNFSSVQVNFVGSRAVDHNVGRMQQPIIMSPVAARKLMTTKSASEYPRNSTTVAKCSRPMGAETTSADQTDIASSRSRPASRTRSSTPEPFRAAAALKATAVSSNRRGSLQTNQKQPAEVSGTNRGARESSVTRSNRSNVASSSSSSGVTSSAVSHARAQSSSRSTPTAAAAAAAAVTTTGSNFAGSRSRSASRRSTPQSTTATPAASSSSTFTPISKPPPAEPPTLYRSATEVRPAAFRASLTPRSPDKLPTSSTASHNMRPSSARLSSSGVSMTSSSPIMPRRSRPAIPAEASTVPAESIAQLSRVVTSRMRAIMTSPLSSSIDAVNSSESDNGSEISKSAVSAVEEADDVSKRDKETACNDLLVESIHAMSLRIHKWTTQIFSKQRLTARRPSSGYDDMMTSNSSSSSENIEDWNNASVSTSNSNNDNNVKLSRTLSVLTDVERLLSKLSN